LPYLTQRATFTHSGITSRCALPLDGFVEHVDWAPGQPHIGGYQAGAPRPGGRFTRLSGVQFELRGQAGSGTQTPEGDILRAAGFARTGSTGYTFALGDPHASTDTPAGDALRIASCALNVDGVQWPLTNCVADVSFMFRAGEIPTLTCDFLGKVGDSDASSTTSVLTSAAVPSVSAGPLPAAWVNSTITINAVSLGSVPVREIFSAVRNRLVPRKSAGGKFGYADADITGRQPGGWIVLEMPPEATLALEDLIVSNASVPIAWSYVAGGSTFRTYSITQTVVFSAMARQRDIDGRLCYVLEFVQDPSTGPLTLGVS
jgi:hypothetical protein